MSVPISGILLDPYGNVARFADIKFVTVQGTLDVIESSSAVFRTDENGAYSINVQFGRFAVLMRFNGNNGAYDKIQTISVNSDTVASTLGELLAYTEPLTPAEILLVQQLVAQAIAAKDDAEAAALQAAIEAANAAASAAAALASEIAAANSVALLAPVPLNGGVWASGQTFTAYNQYMIYNGEAYSPRQETVLPYTVGAAPDLGFVYQIKLNSLQALSGLTEPSGLDSVYNRVFDNVQDMIDYTGHSIGFRYLTGGTSWERVSNIAGLEGFKLLSDIFLDDFNGGSDWSSSIALASASTIAAGRLNINISGANYPVLSRPPLVSEVVFVGDGVFSGAGAYRFRQVSSKTSAAVPNQTVVPSQLKVFAKTDNPVVVIAGDSLTTVQPDSLDQTGTLANLIKTKLQSDNPDKTISYYNRGIGGQTFTTFNGLPSVFPPEWYINTSKPWIDYIEELEPDLVIIGFGMNDGQNDGFVMADAISAINKIKSFSKPCDIIFVTTPVPTTSATGSFADYSTFASQNGRDRVGGFVRTYAEYYGHGYIDANRMSGIVRDGVDVTKTITERSSIDVVNGGAIMPSKSSDFSIQLSCSASAFTTPGSTFAVKVGPDRLDVVLISDSGGFLKFDFYAGGVYKSVTSAMPTPATDWNLLAEKRGNRFYASQAGTTPVDSVVSELLICGGGVFNPSAGWFESDYTSGPVNWPFFANAGFYERRAPSATDSELWGVFVDGDAGLKLPYGGNGINHPSSVGVTKFYAEPISKCNMAASEKSSDSFSVAGVVSVPTGVDTAVAVFDGFPYTFGRGTSYSISVSMQATLPFTGGVIRIRLGTDTAPGAVIASRSVSDGYMAIDITRPFTKGDSVTLWLEHSTGASIDFTNIFSNVIEV